MSSSYLEGADFINFVSVLSSSSLCLLPVFFCIYVFLCSMFVSFPVCLSVNDFWTVYVFVLTSMQVQKFINYKRQHLTNIMSNFRIVYSINNGQNIKDTK